MKQVIQFKQKQNSVLRGVGREKNHILGATADLLIFSNIVFYFLSNYKCYSLQLDSKLDEPSDMEAVNTEGQSVFLLLLLLLQEGWALSANSSCALAVASASSLRWCAGLGGAHALDDSNSINGIKEKASTTVGISQDWVELVAECLKNERYFEQWHAPTWCSSGVSCSAPSEAGESTKLQDWTPQEMSLLPATIKAFYVK